MKKNRSQMNQLFSRRYDAYHRRATNKKHYSLRATFDAARITKKKKVSERANDRSIDRFDLQAAKYDRNYDFQPFNRRYV